MAGILEQDPARVAILRDALLSNHRRSDPLTSAVAPIFARMPSITYLGYLRQGVAYPAMIAGLRP